MMPDGRAHGRVHIGPRGSPDNEACVRARRHVLYSTGSGAGTTGALHAPTGGAAFRTCTLHQQCPPRRLSEPPTPLSVVALGGMASAAAAGAVGVTMVAVTCGATAIAALLLAQHEKQEARLAEALRLLAQKEEQLQQACYERSRLNDQLAADRAARVAERSASSVSSSTAPAGGPNPEAPKALPLDPRLLGFMPSRRSSSGSPQAPSTKPIGAGETASTAEPASQFHVATQSCNGAPQSAAVELAELRQADVEGVVQFLHVSESTPASVELLAATLPA